LQPIILPAKNVAGDYEFHYWDGQGDGDVGRPSETIDIYGSDAQTGWIGKIWLLP
jgi:hypothetical protein